MSFRFNDVTWTLYSSFAHYGHREVFLITYPSFMTVFDCYDTIYTFLPFGMANEIF